MVKAQSQIVTSVLLILIVISLAVLVLNFSTSFVKNKLSDTGCFEVVGQVYFTESNKYTCFNDSDKSGNNDHLLLQIHVSDVNNSISGFLVEIGGADTKSLEIKDGVNLTDVSMYGGSKILSLPKKNEERTYIFSVISRPEKVKVYPILSNEKVCETADSIEKLNICRS